MKKRFIALVVVFGMMLAMMPTLKRTEVAVITGSIDMLTDLDYKFPQDYDGQNMADKKYGDFKYREDGNGNIVITGYTGKDKKVTIPSKINGKTVICIYGAFCV